MTTIPDIYLCCAEFDDLSDILIGTDKPIEEALGMLGLTIEPWRAKRELWWLLEPIGIRVTRCEDCKHWFQAEYSFSTCESCLDLLRYEDDEEE